MSAVIAELPTVVTANALRDAFNAQQAAYLSSPAVSVAERREDLKTLKKMINDNREEFIAAINEDYGNRSRNETLFAEIISVTDAINDAIHNLKKWSKVQRRKVDWALYAGAKNRVIPQPLGCVGIIAPWNFPSFLSLGPLTAAFAAGNRAMVKMSENSRAFSRLLIRISPDYFPPEKLLFLEETGGVGIEFSKIPFDLLFFTGSGATGRKVMAAAAENLTPVVLELGGKSPAVIDPSYPLDKAVQRIMFVKQFNAGQICINVDYVFVHESQIDEFVSKAKAWNAEHIPDIHNDDYTAIIDDASFKRLENTMNDAIAGGAEVINLSDHQDPDIASRKMPLHLVLNSGSEMTIRQRETFGPLLLVMPYDTPEDVIEYVRSQDRPLSFYPFTHDKKLLQRYLDNIMSGGVTVNDALYHIGQHDMPFGGVGASGMGHYHGREGFETFSKMRPVFHQTGLSFMKFLQPPYGNFAKTVYRFMAWFKD